MDRRKRIIVAVLLVVLVVMTVLNLYLYIRFMTMKAEMEARFEKVRLKVRSGGESGMPPLEKRDKTEEPKEKKKKERPDASGAVRPM